MLTPSVLLDKSPNAYKERGLSLVIIVIMHTVNGQGLLQVGCFTTSSPEPLPPVGNIWQNHEKRNKKCSCNKAVYCIY